MEIRDNEVQGRVQLSIRGLPDAVHRVFDNHIEAHDSRGIDYSWKPSPDPDGTTT